MSRLDVLRSLVRSSALGAAERLRLSSFAISIERAFKEATLGRVRVADAALSGAVARLPGATEATVSSTQGRIHVDAAFEDGEHLAFSLRPAGTRFAAGGAKEVSFALETAAVTSAKVGDIVSAIVGELARSMFRPVLGRAPGAAWPAPATREGLRVVVDLRSVPEIRWALSRRWGHAALELVHIKSLEAVESGVQISLGLERR